MIAVAIRAGGGVSLSFRRRQTVNRGTVATGGSAVTLGAMGGLRSYVVVGVLAGEVGMATHASVGLVHGCGQLCLIHEEGNLLTGGVGFA